MSQFNIELLFVVYFVLLTNILDKKSAESSMLFLGASITSGHGLPQSEAFPMQLENLFEKNKIDINIINAAVAGAGTQHGLGQIKPFLKKENNINYIIICLGLSDAVYKNPPEQIKNNLIEIIGTVSKFDSSIKIFLTQSKIFQRHVMAHVAPEGSNYEIEYEKVFKDVAESEGVILLPFFLEGVAGDAVMNQADQLHPNKEGACVIARFFYNNLIKHIN